MTATNPPLWSTGMSDTPPNTAVETPEHLADTFLAPIRAWATSNRGAFRQLAEKMTTLAGKEIDRTMVGRWLSDREERHQHPSLGYGLLLAEAYRQLATK